MPSCSATASSSSDSRTSRSASGRQLDAPLVQARVQLFVRQHGLELLVRAREPLREAALDEAGRHLEGRALDQRVEQRAAQRLAARRALAAGVEHLAEPRAERVERLDALLAELLREGVVERGDAPALERAARSRRRPRACRADPPPP